MSITRWMQRPHFWFHRKPAVLEPVICEGSSSKMQLVRFAKFGIYVDPEDRLIGGGIANHGTYEPHLAKFISQRLKRGQTFLDLGSNVGFHTLTAAKCVGARGRCIAVDINPGNCALLRASCDYNGFSHVEIHEKAAAAETGQLSFFTTPQTGNSAILTEAIRARMPDEPQWFGEVEQRVEAVAIDDLVGEDPVHLVKIDIEGSEAKAIAGMKRLLSRQRPPVLFEFFPNLLREIGEIEPRELLDTFRGLGYQIHRLEHTGKLSKRPLSNDEAMPPEGEILTDLFASPV